MAEFKSGFYIKVVGNLDFLTDAELSALIEEIRTKQVEREDDRMVDFALSEGMA
jgi:hypothetical protein